MTGRGLDSRLAESPSSSRSALVEGGRLWRLETFGSVCRCVSAGDVRRAMSCKHCALCRAAIGRWLWENFGGEGWVVVWKKASRPQGFPGMGLPTD